MASKIGRAAARIAVESERLPAPVRRIHSVVVDSVGDGSQQRSVVVVEQGDGQSGGEAHNSGHRPAEPASCMQQSIGLVRATRIESWPQSYGAGRRRKARG